METHAYRLVERRELETALQPEKPHSSALLIDRNVADLHPWLIEVAKSCGLPWLSVEAVETRKTLGTCAEIWDFLAAKHVDRRGHVWIAGGGWMMDLCGFACATWKRGVSFSLIPTTLIGQADACIGGKCGVNYRGSKNQVGLFAPAKQALVWPGFLETLPERQLRAGWAELAKHGLIADREYWETVRTAGWPPGDWTPFIERSLALKQAVVREDPLESGLRETLNFGHTLGHALESWSLTTDTPLLHGEAVWYGMLLETWLSTRFAGLPHEEAAAVEDFIRNGDFLVNLPVFSEDTLLDWVRQDKKNIGMSTRLSLLTAAGRAQPGFVVPDDALTQALRMVHQS